MYIKLIISIFFILFVLIGGVPNIIENGLHSSDIFLILIFTIPSIFLMKSAINQYHKNKSNVEVPKEIEHTIILNNKNKETLHTKSYESDTKKQENIDIENFEAINETKIFDFDKDYIDTEMSINSFSNKEDEFIVDNEITHNKKNDNTYISNDSVLDKEMTKDNFNTKKTIISDEEDLYEICKKFIIQAQKASTSLLQRKFRIGYNQSAKIIEQLEMDGIIGPQLGSRPREVLIESYCEENSYNIHKNYNRTFTEYRSNTNVPVYTITSANNNLKHFYYLIKNNAPISKDDLKKYIDMNEYQFEYSLNILFSNNAIYYHINDICINDNFKFVFEFEYSEKYEILSLIYDTNKYKEFQNIKTGIEFEYYLAELLKENKYMTEVTPKSNDYGADIIAIKDNIKYAIQCKFYSNPIGISAVQEVLGALKYYDSNIAIVATNSTFTSQAKELAKKSNVILWDGNYIMKTFILKQES